MTMPQHPTALGGLLEALEAPAPSPAGGTAAAAAAAMGASLVVMVAQGSPAWPDGTAVAHAAAALRDRLLGLGAEDVAAFAAVLAAYRGSAGEATSDLAEALLHASRVPLAIAEAAADVAELAARAQADGKPAMRPDASAAALLAEASARAAAQLVGVNLDRLPQTDADEQAGLTAAAAAAATRARLASPAPA
jgi:methenyltetrahydrofolate cyclohydrolase